MSHHSLGQIPYQFAWFSYKKPFGSLQTLCFLWFPWTMCSTYNSRKVVRSKSWTKVDQISACKAKVFLRTNVHKEDVQASEHMLLVHHFCFCKMRMSASVPRIYVKGEPSRPHLHVCLKPSINYAIQQSWTSTTNTVNGTS